MASWDAEVAVVGAGVVGAALAHALSARGVAVAVLEAEQGPALGASGSNSGILHTGFDSKPGDLETQMILRSAQLRDGLLAELGVPFRRCGARLTPRDEQERETVATLAANAATNGVQATLSSCGALEVPGESITDPALLTRALLGAAAMAGAELRGGAEVVGIGGGERDVTVELEGGDSLLVGALANCAGLQADELAGMVGERPFEIYPRKGEFLVFEQPAEGPLQEILLPVPSAAGKGVLVFPTLDGHLIAGPTARDRADKRDWSVEPGAAELILRKARGMFPALEDAEPIVAYAGLRPAGRGVNYVIEPSPALPRLINVAAIRSTGVSAAFGIAEHVTGLLARAAGLRLTAPRALPAPDLPAAAPWWQSAAQRSRGAA